MGSNSKTILYRRMELLEYLISVPQTSYQSLRSEFDVTDKVIASDINYLRDALGIPIETHTGPYGYVRIAKEWKRRKVHLTIEEQNLLIGDYVNETDLTRRMIYKGILIKACSPELYQDLL